MTLIHNKYPNIYKVVILEIILWVCMDWAGVYNIHVSDGEFAATFNPWQQEAIVWGFTYGENRMRQCHMSTFRYNSKPIQYIPRNMHTVFALLCFVVVIHWLIFPYPSGLLHWHCGNLTIAPVPAKQPRWIWINISRGFIMNDCITTTKQSTTKPCAYFLGYTVPHVSWNLTKRRLSAL